MSSIKIVECSRDAMQGIKQWIPSKDKLDYLQSVLSVGFDVIDFGSFVSKRAIPQMSDSAFIIDNLDLSNTKSKFTKIHFQLQDIMGINTFMGGLNFVAVGDFRQLPPVLDSYVYERNHLDGRPALAPSHWDENFQIFYLTEKMRSQKDPEFSGICDRIGNGKYNKHDLEYLKSCVRNTNSENQNESFKEGKLSIIVTTNKRRQAINETKLMTLLEFEKSYEIIATDRSTNLANPPEVPNNLAVTQTGGLEKRLIIKKKCTCCYNIKSPYFKI